MRDVVVVPRGEEHRGRRGAPDHHEGGEVGGGQMRGDVDGGEDDEAAEGEGEAEGDEGEADAREVRGEGEDEEEHGADAVGRDRVQVRLDGVVLERGDDLRHEQAHRLQRHTETNLNRQKAIRGRQLEDLQGVLEVEFLAYDGGRVDLDAREGELLLVLGEEAGFVGVLGEPPVGDEGEADGEGSLDEEQVAPSLEFRALDVEDAEGEEAGEGVGDVGRGVEEGEAPGEFAAAVEGGEVVDDEGEEGGLGHAWGS